MLIFLSVILYLRYHIPNHTIQKGYSMADEKDWSEKIQETPKAKEIPEGLFTRRARINLPEELPLPVRVFMIWLTVILWKRDADNN